MITRRRPIHLEAQHQRALIAWARLTRLPPALWEAAGAKLETTAAPK